MEEVVVTKQGRQRRAFARDKGSGRAKAQR